MNITYNNIDLLSAIDLVTFSDVPNILSVTDSTSGTNAVLKITVADNWKSATSSNNQWWLQFQGDTISNVLEPQNAVNKNFYINTSKRSTAVSMCRALRACPSITAKFQVYLDTDSSKADIYLKAREIGQANLTVTMAANMSNYITTATTAGTASSTLINSKIDVDVYSNGDYVTTLEKNYYGGECAFDMTPVLATISKIKQTVPYTLYLTAIDESGTTTNLGSIVDNSASVGYMVNQGDKFLTINSGITIAQNVARGKLRDAYNSSLLYVYGDTIPLSFYTQATSGDVTVSISYKNSAFQEISTGTYVASISGSTLLHTFTVDLTIPSDCFYVDLTIGGKKLRYDVIKPLNAAYGCQRVYWINSYGGTSFFDFCGNKTIENTSETVTYSKNHFDYYTNPMREKELVYNVDTKTTYTLKTHLIAEDGKWQLYDLLQSSYAWTNINGEDYVVIIESVSAEEKNNQDVYEMTVKFRISQPTSI